MKKYEVLKRDVEFTYRNRFEVEEGCTIIDEDPEIVETFDNKEEALEALKKYETTVETVEMIREPVIRVTEYVVEENEVDEDGDIIESIGTLDVTEMKIEVAKGYDTVAVFNSYEDAEKAVKASDDELYIS